jgi:hypothetical protein
VSGASESGSTISIGSGSTLRFSGLAFWIKPGTNFSNSGTLDVSLGDLRASNTILASAHVQMNGFELGIDGNLDDNQFTWNRGELTGPGVTKLTADRAFSVPWGVGSGRILSTNGHNLTWTDGFFGSGLGDSVFGYTGAGTISNSTGSTFTINLPASSAILANGSSSVSLNNSGTFVLASNTAVTLSGEFNNSGTVTLNAGTLIAQHGGKDDGAFRGSGTLVLDGGSHTFTSSSTIDPIFLQVQTGFATLQNTTAGAYQSAGVIVGDPTNDTTSASMTIPAGVSVSGNTLTVIAGSNLNVSGGGFVASNSIVLDQASPGTSEDGGITVTNNGSLSAAYISVRHATLDLESGTIAASGSFEVTGGTVNFGSAGHVTTPDMELTGGTVNVSAGFSWPSPTFDANGSTIDLKPGASQSFSTTSDISAGGFLVENGATLSVGSMIHSGASEVDGNLVVAHSLTMGDSSQFTVNSPGVVSAGTMLADGTVQMGGGKIVATSGASIAPTGVLAGTGTLDGSLAVSGAVVPGNPTGDLTVTGDMNLVDASQLVFQVDASTPSIQTAHLTIGGNATLAGAVTVLFLNDSVLLPNQSVELVHWNSRNGTFDSASLVSPFVGLTYELTYAADHLTLEALALPGDSNLDGSVNALDFNILASNFGQSTSVNWLNGDLNGDGVVNTMDFTLLANGFGASMSPAISGSLVPEPCALAILPGMMWLGLRQRSRARPRSRRIL